MAMATLMFFDDEEVSSMEPKTTRVPTKKQLQNYVHFFFQTHPAFEAGARASTGECDGDGRKAITITTTCTAHSFHQFPDFPCAPVSLYFLFSCSVWWTCQRGKDGGKWSCLRFGNCRCLASIVFIDDFDDVDGNGYDEVVDMDDFVLGKPILLWFR